MACDSGLKRKRRAVATVRSDKLRGFAGVAQLVEQRIRNAKVTSSIPVTGTKHF